MSRELFLQQEFTAILGPDGSKFGHQTSELRITREIGIDNAQNSSIHFACFPARCERKHTGHLAIEEANIMWKTYRQVVVLIALFPGIAIGVTQEKGQQKDPPARFKGIVTSVDASNPNATFVTIKVKEMRPTAREDEVVPVEKSYQFRLVATTKILGMDGKPYEGGVKKLKQGTKVQIEAKGEPERVATLIEVLAPS
jgi:hypothetical protein